MRSFEPRQERQRQRRINLEKEAPGQRGMGDLAAEFRDVTRGMEGMIDRVPDPILSTEAERAGLDQIDDKARRDASGKSAEIAETADRFDVTSDSPADPGGVDLDISPGDFDMEGL